IKKNLYTGAVVPATRPYKMTFVAGRSGGGQLFSGVNRRQRPLRILTSLVLATLMLSTRCLLPARAQASQSSRPKLVLLLVADQFSYDYLNRYQDRLGAGGLRFLMEHGANFLSCKFEQGTTHTATGHAIIATGANPWATGIVANDWFD